MEDLQLPQKLINIIEASGIDVDKALDGGYDDAIFEMTGTMTKDGKKMPFTAKQRNSCHDIDFHWIAKFPMVSDCLNLTVEDSIAGGKGSMKGRILFFPLFKEEGDHIDVGEAYRWLAELPLAPAAFISAAKTVGIRWTELLDGKGGKDTQGFDYILQANLDFKGHELAVRYSVDEQLRIRQIMAKNRPYVVNGVRSKEKMLWKGRLFDYCDVGDCGIMIPANIDVSWIHEDGEIDKYFDATIISYQLTDSHEKE